MTLGEVLEELRRRKCPASSRQVHSYITDGTVSKPRKDGSGRYDYRMAHVDEIQRRLDGRRAVSVA